MKSLFYLLALLMLGNSAVAGNSKITYQSYDLPIEVWLKVPDSMRHDSPALLNKIKSVVHTDKAEINGRVSLICPSDGLHRAGSYFEQIYPTGFSFMGGSSIVCPTAFESRRIGTILECEYSGRTGILHYNVDRGQNPPWVPILTGVSRANEERYLIPRFQTSRIQGQCDLPVGRPTLVSVLPHPSDPEETVTLTFFTLTRDEITQPPIDQPSDNRQVGTILEIVLIKGGGGAKLDSDEGIQKVISKRKNVVRSVLVDVSQLKSKLRLIACTEMIWPTVIRETRSGVPFPDKLDTCKIGMTSKLKLEDLDGVSSLEYDYSQDIHPPVIPSKPKDGPSPELRRFVVKAEGTKSIPVGEWVLLDEVKLDAVLDAKHEDSNLSCYLVARLSAPL